MGRESTVSFILKNYKMTNDTECGKCTFWGEVRYLDNLKVSPHKLVFDYKSKNSNFISEQSNELTRVNGIKEHKAPDVISWRYHSITSDIPDILE